MRLNRLYYRTCLDYDADCHQFANYQMISKSKSKYTTGDLTKSSGGIYIYIISLCREQMISDLCKWQYHCNKHGNTLGGHRNKSVDVDVNFNMTRIFRYT